MSFDVFLERFEKGESADVPREPVLDILRQASFSQSSTAGFYIVSFPDGTDVDFSASGLESARQFTGCAFHIRTVVTDAIATFILAIARAGSMVIIPAMKSNPLILVSEGQAAHVPVESGRDLRPIVVQSPAQLRAVLTLGVDGWVAYRDYTLNDSG